MARTITHPALQPLKEAFADTKLLVGEFRDMVTVVVPRERIVAVCTFLRDDAKLRYDMLAELNGVDYLQLPRRAAPLRRQLRPDQHPEQQPPVAEGLPRPRAATPPPARTSATRSVSRRATPA